MTDVEPAKAGPRARIFESYGHVDASELAERLRADLASEGYEVWRDEENLRNPDFMSTIGQAIEESDVLVALMSPHSVRNAIGESSVCLDEIAKARFDNPAKPIVPVMAAECQRPFALFRLLYVDLVDWQNPAVYESGLTRLKQMIDEALSAVTPLEQMFETPLVVNLDPLDFGGFLNPLREKFHGRLWLFEEIDRWRNESEDPVLLITGDPGAGKSSIVAELIYGNPGGQVVAYHCCRHDDGVTRRPGKFVKSLATMLASQIPQYSAAIERGNPFEALKNADADPESAFEQGILNPLAAIRPPPGPARYILIDALDEVLVGNDDADRRTIIDLIARRKERFPKWLRLVATTRHQRDVLDRFKGTATSFLNAQDPRNLRDLEEYVGERLKEPLLERLVADADLTRAEVVSQLSRLSSGSFLYAEQFLQSIARKDVSLTQMSDFPSGLSALYRTYFERTFPDDAGYAAPKAVLSVLLAASSGLTKPQLTAILGLSAIDLEKALAPISGYLAQDQDLLRVFHKSLADWLTDPEKGVLRFVIERQDGQQRILEYCRRWAELEDDYPLRELPAQLADAGELDELLALLTNDTFAERRRRVGVRDHIVIEDYRLLTHLLLKRGRTEEVGNLARTVDATQRDGVAMALRETPAGLETEVHSVVATLAIPNGGKKGRDQPTPEETNGRLVAMRIASERGYGDLLAALAQDPSVAVRAMLVPYLFKFWKQRRDEGWKLLDDLAPHFTKRMGMPRDELVETIGGLALAITSEFFDDDAIMARLGEYLAGLVKQAMASPVRRAVGKGLLLKAGIAALTKVIKEQPEYQPMNLVELTKSFPRPQLATRKALDVLDVLEQPDRDVDEIVKVMTTDQLDFDLFLMSTAERALIVKGAQDPDATLRAIRQIYDQGFPWFQQSALYSISKILETCDLDSTGPQFLDTYAELMADFVRTTRATLRTQVGTYSLSSTLAGIEVVFERHRPEGRARFLPEYFKIALAENDEDLAVRVVKAAHLVSLLGQPSIALDAIDPMADVVDEHPALEKPIVEVLANIRLFEDAAVDSRLASRYQPQLARLVHATSPTVSANEFPTMIDFFVNHQLIHSEDGRRAICDAYRRALNAKSGSDVIYEVIVWVTGLLTGTDVRH